MSDQFICDTPKTRKFIQDIKNIIETTPSTVERLAAVRPFFSELMNDPDWLPDEFRQTYEHGGMGKGIANWLLYRDLEGSLSLSALVLPHGAATPVHDHLAWGLVGLYVGEQTEEIYETTVPVGGNDNWSDVTLVNIKHLATGSFYELIPPFGDIHRVVTTSPEPSISLHLLGNDVGCVSRHRFEPETGDVVHFRSGYTNIDCENKG